MVSVPVYASDDRGRRKSTDKRVMKTLEIEIDIDAIVTDMAVSAARSKRGQASRMHRQIKAVLK